MHFPRAASERQPVHAAGQIDVGEQECRPAARREVPQGVTRVGHRVHDKSLLRQVFGNHFADQEFILDKQHANRLSLTDIDPMATCPPIRSAYAPCDGMKLKMRREKILFEALRR